ncbi:unnamed protein product [Adineta steineri]|uniref:Uncharacterized protein n=1 Tax=Adineta steineri TaxID=433720 RepID=A0A814I4Z8_9BILA|nr:unnamed protein product [Adineta steineri]CAF3969410.1 unnamed protein product [Adineta steineri]
MGAKLGKNTHTTISKKLSGQEKEATTVSNNHYLKKASTLERKTKKKEHVSNKKSADAVMDKYTSTDGDIIPSSAYIRKLVIGPGCNLSYDSLNGLTTSRRQSDAPSKDVLEFRDACIRRGIISRDTACSIISTCNEEENQVDTVEQSTNERITTTITVVPNTKHETESEQQDESQANNEW